MAKSIERIVSDRIVRWEAQQRSAPDVIRGREKRTAPEQHPMITISREFGSRGGDLGRALARELDCAFYSQDLVHEIAVAAHVHDDVVATMDEHAWGSIEVMIREMLEGEAFAADDYLRSLETVLRELGRRSPGIVLGRGAHLVFSRPRTLALRVYAAMPVRVENVARRDRVSEADARAAIERVDKERASFHRTYFNADIRNSLHFDLMLNTGTMSLPDCVKTVAAAYRARFGDGRGSD